MINYHDERAYSTIGERVQKPLDIDIIVIAGGMAAEHNMPCSIFPTRPAVLSGGIFEPCWEAQSCGWRTIKVRRGREWLWNLIGKYLFEDFDSWRDKISKPIRDDQEVNSEVLAKQAQKP
jgi:hypothetical protein